MDGITDSRDMSLSKLRERVVEDRRAWCATVHGVAWIVKDEHNLKTEQQQIQPVRVQSRPSMSTRNLRPSPEVSRARRCRNLPVFQGMPAAPAQGLSPPPFSSTGSQPRGAHSPCPQGVSASSLHTLPWLASPDNPSVRLWALITGGSPGLPEIGWAPEPQLGASL